MTGIDGIQQPLDDDSVDLAGLIEIVAKAQEETRDGPIIARVESYDAAAQTCDCTPVVRRVVDGDLLEPITMRGVKVGWLSAGGATPTAAVTLPLAAGDYVQLIVQASDHSAYLASHQDGAPATTPRRWHLSDVLALAMARSVPLPVDAWASDGPVIMGSQVYLGGSTASDFVALASLVLAQLNTIKDAFNAHGHLETGAVTGTPVTTPAGAPPIVISITDVKSNVVRSK
jgi:hypothetical protein